ncbi:MAG TPA: PspC domain-containing protein [Candidatus Ornithospirochaeta avicola]|uniref:PspC domain-containing protein n=1 Tax=Candidatus Ornithospirochaeta avicola TaxID=2840896 RepID=A0A9D1TMM7_9SPIO|nr:PspC domain-containing protein [Candidatus Ornithospirochaeta avicola]
MTKKWTRSPRGPVMGVVTGFAEWRDLPADTMRVIIFLIILFTGVFPGLAIYLILAVALPAQREDDVIYEDRGSRQSFSRRAKYEDAKWEERSTEDLEKEYQNLKRKVEEMESRMFDKEKDWDERFKNSNI